jgi:ABC-type molybdate transport system substrate-binding protein
MTKKTRLDDDATIYKKNDRQSEKEKLKDMSTKEKLSYFWDYYRYHALIVISLILILSYIIYTYTKPRLEVSLNAAVINSTIASEIWNEYAEKVTEYMELDPLSEELRINDTFYFNGSPDYEANMRQALAIYVAATDIDIVFAPESEFTNYADNDFFAPLSDQLPTDLYSSLTDMFYLSDTEDNPKVAAYGIYVSDTKLYKEHSYPTENDPVIIGIISNSKRKQNAVEFIRFLFSEE